MVRRFITKYTADREQLGRVAAADCAKAIRTMLAEKELLNIVFAAAPSQNEFLQYLGEDGSVDFSRIRAFHMDEYIGLGAGAPQLFSQYLKTALFSQKPFAQVHYINGHADDPEQECVRYAGLLQAYPPDIVCLGVGENGHLAFNDPGTFRFTDTALMRVVQLDERCRQQQVNDGCFTRLDEVPTRAITMTIAALGRAAYHFCMVPSSTKAQAVRQMIYGPVDEDCPASILRTFGDVSLYLDQDSGQAL